MARKNPSKNAPAAALDMEAVAARGMEIAEALRKTGAVTANCYAACRTVFVDAQRLGQLPEALSAFFSAGNKVKFGKGDAGGSKWRAYKSLFNSAHTYSIALTHDMSQAQLAAAIKEAKGGTTPEKLLEMALRLCAGYLNAGGDKAKLVAAVKAIEA